MILVLVALSTLVVSNLMKSRVGYAILAIRDDELAAEAMGIHVFRYKMIVFILSSLLVGLAGAFYATYNQLHRPQQLCCRTVQRYAGHGDLRRPGQYGRQLYRRHLAVHPA